MSRTSSERLIYVQFTSYIYWDCLKSVQIRRFFWSVFSPSKEKCRPEETPHLDTFYTVWIMVRFLIWAAFWDADLNRGRRFLEGSAYFDLSVNGAVLIWGPTLIKDHSKQGMKKRKLSVFKAWINGPFPPRLRQ